MAELSSWEAKFGEPHVYRQYMGGVICVARLVGALSINVPSDEPRRLHYFKGHWECWNSRCEARQVQVSFKHYDGKMPPKLKCPVCGEPLKFGHYLKTEEYILDDPPPPPAGQ
jgi:hypothetical protein